MISGAYHTNLARKPNSRPEPETQWFSDDRAREKFYKSQGDVMQAVLDEHAKVLAERSAEGES